MQFLLHVLCECSQNDRDVPLVLIHGFGADETVFDELILNIKKNFPERTVLAPHILFGFFSSIFCGLTRYTRVTATKIQEITNAECIDVIGHSQGGLVARAYIQLYSGEKGHPRVRNFISLAGAQGGFYCGDNCPDFGSTFNKWMKAAQKAMYSNFLQVRVTPAGFWRDPYKYSKYQKQCGVLAKINGECLGQTEGAGKANMLKLSKYYNMYSAIDEILLPSTSGNFAMYEPETGNILELEQNPIYTEDRIGLKQLKTQGKLVQCRRDIYHMDFIFSQEYYEQFIFKLLSNKAEQMLCQ
ncbi:Palmitoyl-protein_thioesterase [Hexamita inflata]|uniref:Palmitoyl-protein thioesterase n=1 Tax=Hexamita inflata TaxID=28002 RepID=A0AA86QY40_9EUKA|nr:Palmitoyl-protein thioesterase [Hexamita inflata]